MANRYPLVIDTLDANKIKELQTGDNLNLADNNIVGVQNITALGTIEAAIITVNGNKVVAQSFTELTDTPANYTGQANNFVAVNSTATGIEYKPLSAFGTIDVASMELDGNIIPSINNNSVIGNTSFRLANLWATEVYASLKDFSGTLIFNAATGKIAYSALEGFPTNVSEFINDVGFATTAGINTAIQSFFSGGSSLEADITGSIFANDSTMLIDGTAGKIVGDIHYPTTGSITAGTKVQLGTTELTSTITPPTNNTGEIGTWAKRFGTGYFQNVNASGNVTAATFNGTLNGVLIGEHTGSVFGEDSSIMVDAINGTLHGNVTGTVSSVGNHSIDALGDVDTLGLSVNQTLIWNGTNFVPGSSFSQSDFNTAFGAKSIRGLSDVNDISFGDGQTLVYNSGNSRFEPGYSDTGLYDGDLTGSVFADNSTLLVDGVNARFNFGNNSLADLNNVSGNVPTAGQVLKWDGAQWAPGTDVTAGGAGTDADTLDGQDSPYFLAWGNFTGTPTTIAGYGITDSVTNSSTHTFTNKTIDADGTGNSITNIDDANIKSAAAISATKIADGTVSNQEFQYLNGLSSAIQTQITGKAALTDISVALGGASGGGSIAYNNATGVITLSPADLSSVSTGDIGFSSATISTATGNTDITLAPHGTGGVVINSNSGTAALTVAGTHLGLDAGQVAPRIKLLNDSGSPAVGDYVGAVTFNQPDSGGYEQIYGGIQVKATNVTNGQEESEVEFLGIDSGGTRIGMMIKDGAGALWQGAAEKVAATYQGINVTGSVLIGGLITLPSSIGTAGQVLTVNAGATAAGWAAAGGGGSIGNFTFASSVIDTDDSSNITVTPAMVIQSDLTVENDLVVNNTIRANKFVSTAVGSPKITSATNIELNAGGTVIVGSSALRIKSFTTTERNALTVATGDIIYNSSLLKMQIRIGSAWKSITISDDVPTNNNQLTNGAGYLTANAASVFTLTSNGSSAYRFAQDTRYFPLASEDDPVLYVRRGETYNFINNSGGGHPFQIRTSNGGGAYNTGVTNNGASSGTIKWTVPMTAPSSVYYQCTAHSSMGNTINIVT